MSTLLIDNYDSYTYNVFHLLAAVSGEEPIVVHNDMVSWRALSRWDFDAIVLSPGPGHPARWHDFGVCSDILRSSDIPVLGICLGHQGLGRVLNGVVGSAPVPMHGRLSNVRHEGTGLFANVPQDFSVVRYHSLAVTGPLGPDGHVNAWTEDGIVMGIEHTRRPLWGVQFHPESIASEHGHAIVENFYRLAAQHTRPRRRGAGRPPVAAPRRRDDGKRPEPSGLELRVRTLQGQPHAEVVYQRLFGNADHAFWLDSATAPSRLAQCSFLGTTAGAEHCVVEYDVDAGQVGIRRGPEITREHASIFDVLDRESAANAIEPPAAVPRGLVGGFVGYLGYECKADCGSPNVHRSDVPDAVFMFANRVIAVDHVSDTTYLLALGQPDDPAPSRWLDVAEAVVRETIDARPADDEAPVPPLSSEPPAEPVVFKVGRGRTQYLSDIARSQAALMAGESYEVCLTDQITTTAAPEPFELYRVLRRRNPAPFAAFLKLGPDLTIVSSSPERFLSIDRAGRVEARPIKGTAARSPDPAQDAVIPEELRGDEKTFAEHLMIVDLLRNDLGRVCEVDSVRVPELMVVEPYPTVHQLVSTIEGRLEADRTPVECVRACFPGGSMTGAPKLRTMSIIDDIERCARGVYSGAIGYFGADGVVDLNIVIRTIVLRPGATTIGAGGAIVMQSDPVEEFDEILLKARAPMAAIAQAATGSDAPSAFTVETEGARAVLSVVAAS
jgi:para-aminobenzoate synthetase